MLVVSRVAMAWSHDEGRRKDLKTAMVNGAPLPATSHRPWLPVPPE